MQSPRIAVGAFIVAALVLAPSLSFPQERNVGVKVGVSMAHTAPALAQDLAPPVTPPPHRARLSADRLLEGRPLPTSFAALQEVLEPGHEIVVRDPAGHSIRGRISSVSRDHLVIFREGGSPMLRRFIPPQERTFPADAVTRIEIVDSTWNGGLIGAVVGVGIVFGIAKGLPDSADRDVDSWRGLAALAYGVPAFATSIGVGRLIDRMTNRPIYERPSQMPHVTIAPLVGRGAVGMMARVR